MTANEEMDRQLIQREECPICLNSTRQRLFSVENDVFLTANPTIDNDAVVRTGLSDIPPIELVACNECGLVYTSELLSEPLQRRFWEEIYKPERSKEKIWMISKRTHNLRKWNVMYSYLLKYVLKDGEILNVLDIGCGWGDFLSVAQSVGVRAVGIETDREKLRFADQNGIEVYTSMNDLPAGITFKAFHCDQVLEHLTHPEAMIGSLMEKMHGDCIGYISVPNFEQSRVAAIRTRMDRGDKVIEKDLNTWDHLNYFSPQTLMFMLNRQGLYGVDPGTNRPVRRTSGTNVFVRQVYEGNDTKSLLKDEVMERVRRVSKRLRLKRYG